MNHTLVIMAAGLGSRFGAGAGQKQVTPVDEAGHLIIDYSIYDAIRAGFKRVVFVIKPESEKLFHDAIGSRVSPFIEVAYAHQTLNDFLPAGFRIPEGREKPWGTGHAALCAHGQTPGDFVVINADDFYGADAYRTIYAELQRLPETGAATMVGYLLKNTVTAHGTVSRGVCHVKDGYLSDIRETLKIALLQDGVIRDEDTGAVLDGDTVVSMNFWGFTPSIFGELERYFHAFLRSEAGQSVKAECLLPTMVGDLLAQGRLTVSVLHSADRWFGMTYHEDRARVAQELVKLHETGVYPAELR